MPGKRVENTVRHAHSTLIIVGSTSKYSAMPAHTPNNILSSERVSFLFIVLFEVFGFVVIGLWSLRLRLSVVRIVGNAA